VTITYARSVRARGFVSLAKASAQDLFDQHTAFGRLALVHVIMMAGDTLVTVSLAGSLFFSVSPTEAKGKVLLYLLLTIAPFAVVSPLLGPLIDRSANGRRLLVAFSAGVRAVLCMVDEPAPQLAVALSLGLSRVGVVEVVRRDARRAGARDGSHRPVPRACRARSATPGGRISEVEEEKGFAGFNAQLTLLGTLAGLIAGSVGAGILKGIGAPSVLVAASVVYVGATVASARLQRPTKIVRDEVAGLTQEERDLNALNPLGDVEVAWGLGVGVVDALHRGLRVVPARLWSTARFGGARVVRLRAGLSVALDRWRVGLRDPGAQHSCPSRRC
jgi:hypothetical protein